MLTDLYLDLQLPHGEEKYGWKIKFGDSFAVAGARAFDTILFMCALRPRYPTLRNVPSLGSVATGLHLADSIQLPTWADRVFHLRIGLHRSTLRRNLQPHSDSNQDATDLDSWLNWKEKTEVSNPFLSGKLIPRFNWPSSKSNRVISRLPLLPLRLAQVRSRFAYPPDSLDLTIFARMHIRMACHANEGVRNPCKHSHGSAKYPIRKRWEYVHDF